MLCFQNVLFLFTESSSVKLNHPWSIFSFLILSLDRSVASKPLNNQGKKSYRVHILKIVDCTDPVLLIHGQIVGLFHHDPKHWILFTPTMNLYGCLQGWKGISLPSHTLLFSGKTNCDHSAGPEEPSHRKGTDFIFPGDRNEQISWFGQSPKSTSVPIALHFALDHQVTVGLEHWTTQKVFEGV